MSAPAQADTTPVESKAQLVEYIEAGCKPPAGWLIGTEHEKFAFRTDDLRPLAYIGNPGIREFLTAMQRFGWEPITEHDQVIALTRADGSNITLEPGGQVELSGAPLETLHQTCEEVQEHLRQIREVGRDLGVAMIGIGFPPEMAARGDAVDAKGPLPDYARAHGPEGKPRPRHDAAHLHRPR